MMTKGVNASDYRVHDTSDYEEEQRQQQDELLDEALAASFPASDPISSLSTY